MREILHFLRDPQNQRLLTWIGGGISTCATAIWAVLKFWLTRTSDAKKRNTATDYSVTVGRGVAIGGSGKVRIGNVRVGYGLGIIFIVGLLLVIIAQFINFAASFLSSADEALPEFSLDLGCGPIEGNASLLDPSERASLLKFKDFLNANNGRQAYVDVSIGNHCLPCGCARARTFKEAKNAAEIHQGTLFIDNPNGSSAEFRRRKDLPSVVRSGHELQFESDDSGIMAYQYYLPRREQLPENGLYLTGNDEYLFSYDGPFTVYVETGTGYWYGYLQPVPTVLPGVLEKLECARNEREMTFWQRIHKHCRLFPSQAQETDDSRSPSQEN